MATDLTGGFLVENVETSKVWLFICQLLFAKELMWERVLGSYGSHFTVLVFETGMIIFLLLQIARFLDFCVTIDLVQSCCVQIYFGRIDTHK